MPSPHVEVHNFPSSLLAVAGHRRWCQACPQVAVATGSAIGSAKRSQAHEQPGPQAHGGSISKPHKAESGSRSSQVLHGQVLQQSPLLVLQQSPSPWARSASSNVHMARRQACPQEAIRSQCQSPSEGHKPNPPAQAGFFEPGSQTQPGSIGHILKAEATRRIHGPGPHGACMAKLGPPKFTTLNPRAKFASSQVHRQPSK